MYVCYPFSITFELFTFCKIKCVVICLELNCVWSVRKICVSDLWFSLSENRIRGKCFYWHGRALCVTQRKATTADTGSGREQRGGEEPFQGGWKKFCFFEERKEWLENNKDLLYSYTVYSIYYIQYLATNYNRKESEKKKKYIYMWFPGGSVVNDPPANARDMGSIPGSGRSPGEGNDNPLQYSCLENHMDRGAWWATLHRVTKSRTWLKQLIICIGFPGGSDGIKNPPINTT